MVSSFSSVDSSLSRGILPLKWEDCKTMDKKIGFVIGRMIPVCINGVWSGVVFTARLVRVDQAANGCGRLGRQVGHVVYSIRVYVANADICPRMLELCDRLYSNSVDCYSITSEIFCPPLIEALHNNVRDCAVRGEEVVSSLYHHVLVPTYTYGLSPLYSYVISPSTTFVGNLIWGIFSGCCDNREPED